MCSYTTEQAKSLVYASLTVFTVSVYLVSVELFKDQLVRLFNVKDIFSFGLLALVAASMLHPARKKIQELVDKSFFRVSYDYKKSILNFIERAQKMINSEQLIDLFLSKIEKTLPIERLGVVIYDLKPDGNAILFQRNEIDGLDNFRDLFECGFRRCGIDLQPSYDITDNLFCFVDFSVERGHFQFTKGVYFYSNPRPLDP